MAQKYSIELNNLSLGGLAPLFYKSSTAQYGNKNQGRSIIADLTNPQYLLSSPGLANLNDGTQASAVTTLITRIMNDVDLSGYGYGIGGAKLYRFQSPNDVMTSGGFPHTIDKGSVTGETGEDLILYHNVLYYSYNHSGSAGDIGTFDLTSTFDDDWGSTVPIGKAALSNAPHQMVVGSDDVLYIANGRYVATWNGTTFDPQALDLPTNYVIESISFNNERLFILAGKRNIGNPIANYKLYSSIFVWDGQTESWEQEIFVNGTGFSLFVKEGINYVFYMRRGSLGNTTIYKLGYISGNSVIDLVSFNDYAPTYNQITDYKDFITWTSGAGGYVYCYGSGGEGLPARLFCLCDGGYETVGGIGSPFGLPFIASNENTNYRIAYLNEYSVSSYWKSLFFDITGSGQLSTIDAIRINFEALSSGARVDFSITDNKGKTLYSDVISYAKLGAVTTVYYPLNGKKTDNFSVEFSYANGSTSVPVFIHNVKIYGTIS